MTPIHQSKVILWYYQSKGKKKTLSVEFFDKDDLAELAARLCGDQGQL